MKAEKSKPYTIFDHEVQKYTDAEKKVADARKSYLTEKAIRVAMLVVSISGAVLACCLLGPIGLVVFAPVIAAIGLFAYFDNQDKKEFERIMAKHRAKCLGTVMECSNQRDTSWRSFLVESSIEMSEEKEEQALPIYARYLRYVKKADTEKMARDLSDSTERVEVGGKQRWGVWMTRSESYKMKAAECLCALRCPDLAYSTFRQNCTQLLKNQPRIFTFAFSGGTSYALSSFRNHREEEGDHSKNSPDIGTASISEISDEMASN